ALKAVAHVPTAVYAMLVPPGEISEQRRAGLRGYREQVALAGKNLEGRGFSNGELERQRQILTGSQEFLDQVLREGQVSGEDVTAFARRMGPLVLANADASARPQLDALHRQVGAWRAEMTPEGWKELRVVIMGSPLPRKGNLNVQYFARLLGELGEGGRIV